KLRKNFFQGGVPVLGLRTVVRFFITIVVSAAVLIVYLVVRPSTTPPSNAKKTVVESEPSSETPIVRSVSKPYIQKREEERTEFVYEQAQRVSLMIGNHKYVFTDEVVSIIKKNVDAYAKRVGTGSTALWGEDLKFMFGRARALAPDIIRAFSASGVPPVIG